LIPFGEGSLIPRSKQWPVGRGEHASGPSPVRYPVMRTCGTCGLRAQWASRPILFALQVRRTLECGDWSPPSRPATCRRTSRASPAARWWAAQQASLEKRRQVAAVQGALRAQATVQSEQYWASRRPPFIPGTSAQMAASSTPAGWGPFWAVQPFVAGATKGCTCGAAGHSGRPNGNGLEARWACRPEASITRPVCFGLRVCPAGSGRFQEVRMSEATLDGP
jgi:hypothetical protein